MATATEKGIITKGITLSYKKTDASSSYIKLTNLQEIPELGGDAETLETTTLDDAAHTYTEGLISYGDSIAFTFLYETAQFKALQALDGECEWKVELPDGTACSFRGKSNVKLAGVGVNAVLTYTLSIAPASVMTWA